MGKKIFLIFLILTTCLTVSSCAPKESVKRDLKPTSAEKNEIKRGSSPEETIPKGSYPKEKQSIIYVPVPKSSLAEMALDSHEGKEGHAKPSISKEGKAKEGIKINVEQMPLNEFINLVLSKTLKRSYYIDKTIEKRNIPVTLKMEVPISPSKFMNMVAEILQRCGVQMKEKDGVLFLTSSPTFRRNAPKKEIPPFFIGKRVPQNIESTAVIGLIFPLYYIDAKRYAPLIKTICLSSLGKSYYIPNTNSVLVVDEAEAVDAAAELVRLFDKPAFENQQAILITLDYIAPKDFKKHLEDILQAQGIPVATKPGKPGVALIPIPELNSLFAVSPKKDWIEILRFWKEKLDDPSVLGDQPQLFVFYPKNRRAKDLASVASKFDAFGAVTVNLKGKIGGKTVNAKRKIENIPPIQKGNETKTGAPPKVRIVVDEGRNALVIMATPTQYQEIKKILKELDVLPKQVMIKVTIAEITLADQLQFGVEWYLRHSTSKFAQEIGTLGNLGIGSQGLFYSVIQETGRFRAALNAFAEKKLIKILSSPHLVVLDNKEASINVGTDVPIVTSETSAPDIQTEGNTSVMRNIEYRNTGVILHIKPTINSGGILTLDVHQEVSEAQTNNISPDISSPLILTRDINTSVVLKSGMTLLLGGLIKDNSSRTNDQVPFLGDIPILGYLFKVSSNSTDRTELIVEITPYIIGSVSEAEEVTHRFRSLIKWYNK